MKIVHFTDISVLPSVSVRVRTAVINMKRASVLDLISQATYIRSEKFKKRTPPNMAKGNQISNAVGNGPKDQRGYFIGMCGPYAPFILVILGGSVELQPYSVGLKPIPIISRNLVSSCHISRGPFYELFKSDICSLRYEVEYTS